MTTTKLAHARPAPAAGKKRSVLLVDDHPLLRRGLVDLIQAEPDLMVCGEASTLAETYSIVAKERPDLVVSDISLEGNNGLELMKELNYRWPDLNLLAYSMHEEEIYAERALRSGAKGYVAKQSPPRELLDAIRVVLDGKVYLSEKMSGKLLGKLVGVGGSAKAFQSPVETLSDRELEVFQYLGKGQTTGQIAETLCLSVKTIETYREHIKHKLNLKSGPELIRYAVEWSLRQTT
jgi:DNA-binding NarL/FixJ family response regulator